MKTSWVIGLVMFYLLILGLEMVMTGSTTFAPSVTSQQSVLTSPTIVTETNVVTQAVAFFSNLGDYISVLIPMLGLWSPTVFSGIMLWVWWFVCFPIDVGIVVTILWILRGVGGT
jgi:hypothetical protein